jgi:tRNA(Ile)-lysidine synthase
VIVAVSGGPDSMALLHLLSSLPEDHGLSLVAAHFDHGVRPGSAEEAETVRGWVERLGLPCRVGRPDWPLEETQAAFRSARYRFLERVADEEGGHRIATGHQADDQAETVLFRILRGTGIRGLAGIPARRGRVVRPLLPFRRAALADYLEAEGISYLEDPSNRDPRWERARLRQAVMPALEETWGGPVGERLLALAAAARRADRALEARAAEALEGCRAESPGGRDERSVALSLEALRALDLETRARVVRKVARGHGVRLTAGGTRAAIEFISEGRSGSGVDIGDGLVVAREFDVLRVGRRPDGIPDVPLRIDAPAAGRGDLRIGGRRRRATWGPGGGCRGGGIRLELALDRLAFPLTVRGWRAGDRIRTPAGTRKLKKLFQEKRVPRSRRTMVPVVVDAGERVVAAGEVATAADVAPGGEDERFVLRIEDG